MKSGYLRTGLVNSLLCLLIGFPSVGFCQAEKLESGRWISSLGLSVGINGFNQKDRYLSPYVFSGTMFASSVSYRVGSGENLQRIDAFISLGGLNSDVQPRDVYQDVGLLSYSYVHALGRWMVGNNRLQFAVGGGLSSLVMNTDFNTVDNVYGTPVYDQSWYCHYSLNLIIFCDYTFVERKSVALQITAPLVGLVSRPKNGHWLNPDNNDVIRNFGNAAVQGKFEPFWEVPVLFTAIDFTQSIAEHLNFRGTYSFAYATSDRPADILSMGMYMNELLMGIEWVF